MTRARANLLKHLQQVTTADGIYYTNNQQLHHQTPRANNLVGGRRNIVGLSEAIREKAFQSTSPSSEATNNGNSSSNFRTAGYETTAAADRTRRNNHDKSTRKPLTVEERLRKLLHSEAESTDDQQSYIENKIGNNHCKKASKMPLRLRSKTPNPHVANNTYHSATLNRNTNYRQQMENYNDELTTKTQSSHHVTNPQPNHHQLTVRSQYFHTSQRRCKSAVPAAFHDHDWNNKISEKPTSPPTNNRQISAHHQQQQHHHVTNNRASKSEQNLSKSDLKRQQQQQQQQQNFPMTSYQIVGRAPPGGGKPVPAVRRSLHADSGFDSSRSTSNNNNHQEQQQHNSNNKNKQATHRNNAAAYVVKSSQLYDDVTVAVHPAPPPYGSLVTEHLMTSSSRATAGRCMTPAPDKRRAVRRDQSPATPSANRKQQQQGGSKQQNISFRRAIRATSSDDDGDDNLHASSVAAAAAPSHIVKRVASSGQTSLSSCATTRATRKSDDRDSGAVLHENPLFDFESSVCSELEQQRRGTATTRSDTPLLPPLDDDVIVEEAAEEEHRHRQQQQQQEMNNLTVVAGYKVPAIQQHKKAEDHHFTTTAVAAAAAHGNNEASTLVDFVKIEGRKQQRARYRGVDDEVDAKLQQQAPSNCNCSSQKKGQDIVGRGGGGAFNPLQDLYDSESIFSLTTASVCSSALRGRGKRHRHGGSKRGSSGQHGGKGDKYAKEIRSINKRFSRLETHVISLARTLAQLGNDIRHQAVSAHQIDQLRNEVKELRTRQDNMEQTNSSHKSTSKKSSKESGKPKMNKFTKFFSEPQQPSLLNLFLKRLGYEKYLKNFQQQSIGMSELPYMDEQQLEAIGIPLGPRSRILTEARKSSFV